MTTPPSEAGPTSPTSRIVRGVAVELTGTALLRALSLVRLIVLARLFVPEDYGGYATGLIVLGLALLLVSGSIQPYVVKAPDQGFPEAFWTAFVLASGLGGVLAVLMVATGPLLASALHDRQLAVILAILAFGALETAVTMPLTLLDRRLRFGFAKGIEAIGLVGGLAATVALARAGVAPVYAMAAGPALSVAFRGALLWAAARPIPPFAFSPRELRAQMRFSAPLVGVSAFAFVESRADDMGVRAMWGNEGLGLYSVAFYAPALLREVIIAIDRVTLPVYARLSDVADLRRNFTTATRLLAIMSVPAGFGLAAFSRPLTVLALGEKWVAAAPIMSIVGIAFGLKGCLGLNWGALAYLSNSTRYLARATVINAALIVVIGLPLIAWLGPVGGAWYTLAEAVCFGPLVRFPLIRRVLGDLSFLGASVRPIVVGGVLATFAWTLGGQHLSPMQGLAGFLAVYLGSGVMVFALDAELRRVLRDAFREWPTLVRPR